MNKAIMIIVALVIVAFSVVGQTNVPQDVNVQLATKVQQEHATTRQVLMNEMDKKVNTGIEEFTKRADYYEQAYRDVTNTFILKLALIFAGIYLFMMAFGHLLNTRQEKKKYDVLVEAVKKDILSQIKTEHISLPREVMENNQIKSFDKPKVGLQKIFASEQKQAIKQQNPNINNQYNQQPQKPKLSNRQMTKLSKKLEKIEKDKEKILKRYGVSEWN